MLSITWIGWTPFITSILAGLLVAYYWIWSRSRFVRLINAVPGPDCLPILGNILALNVPNDGACNLFCFFIKKDNNSEILAFIKNVYFSEIMDIVSGDWVKKYGSIYRVWFGLRPVILLTAPELLEVCSVYKNL
jgi:cytochrome P450 family 4